MNYTTPVQDYIKAQQKKLIKKYKELHDPYGDNMDSNDYHYQEGFLAGKRQMLNSINKLFK
jgi:hypothetical protein